MPNSINYLGGGLKNTGTPIEHYKIIDERRSESRKVDNSAKASEVFAKALSKEKINDAIKKNETESIANKAVKSLDKDSTLGARNIRLNKSGANVAPSLAKNGKTASEPDGTDLARMKKVAKELTDQVYGFLWAQMAEGVNQNPEGGFGEAIFQKSLWPELVKNSTGNDLDEIGKAIVRDLVKQQENNVKQRK